ncbi:Uncharacterized protein FKW44_017292, partial [Caligus rogercresseyi]
VVRMKIPLLTERVKAVHLQRCQALLNYFKVPCKCNVLGICGLQCIAAPLIWFPTGFRLNAADYIKVLKTKFLPWVRESFLDGNVVFQ